MKHSDPVIEAILKDEAKPTPEEIAAAFGPNDPVDENCGEGVAEVENLTTPVDSTALATIDPGVLTFELEGLRRKPLTRMVVEEAREWDSKAKLYLEQAEKSPVREKIGELFRQHRFWLARYNAAVDPVKKGREFVSTLFGQWERKRVLEAAEQRRKDEAAAIALQEAARKADVAHLKVLGHKTEAKELAAAPLPPVVLPEPKNPPGKVVGVSVIPVWKFGGFTDEKAFFHFIADHPEYWNHMEQVESKWKRTLTDAKGKLEVPGMKVIEGTETRNRS